MDELKERLKEFTGFIPEQKEALLEFLRVNLIYDDTSEQINTGGVKNIRILTSKSGFGGHRTPPV